MSPPVDKSGSATNSVILFVAASRRVVCASHPSDVLTLQLSQEWQHKYMANFSTVLVYLRWEQVSEQVPCLHRLLFSQGSRSAATGMSVPATECSSFKQTARSENLTSRWFSTWRISSVWFVLSNNLRVFASTNCKTWSAGEAEGHFNIDLHQAYKHEENNLPGFSSVFHEKLSWRGKVG